MHLQKLVNFVHTRKISRNRYSLFIFHFLPFLHQIENKVYNMFKSVELFFSFQLTHTFRCIFSRNYDVEKI